MNRGAVSGRAEHGDAEEKVRPAAPPDTAGIVASLWSFNSAGNRGAIHATSLMRYPRGKKQ
jgi:hypothetical protein